MRFDETVRLSVQEVLFGFQGAMIRFCRLLPGRVDASLKTQVLNGVFFELSEQIQGFRLIRE